MSASLDAVGGELATRGGNNRERRGRLGCTGQCDGLIDGLADDNGGERGSQGSNACRWAGTLGGRDILAGYRKRIDWARDAAGDGDGTKGRNARGCSEGWHGYRCSVENARDRTVSTCRRHCVSDVSVEDVRKGVLWRERKRKQNKQKRG